MRHTVISSAIYVQMPCNGTLAMPNDEVKETSDDLIVNVWPSRSVQVHLRAAKCTGEGAQHCIYVSASTNIDTARVVITAVDGVPYNQKLMPLSWEKFSMSSSVVVNLTRLEKNDGDDHLALTLVVAVGEVTVGDDFEKKLASFRASQARDD